MEGATSRHLKQVHLHIDDPTLVIAQNSSEQQRRDLNRSKLSSIGDAVPSSAISTENNIVFQEELKVLWSSLLVDRTYKDELASLHLFCTASRFRASKRQR